MTRLDLKKLGVVLYQLRIESSMTLRGVADQMSITHKSVQFWEQGVNEIKLSKFIELCALYDTTPDRVLERANLIVSD
ncbi:helix-turn-helix transcriptional regulator [Erysipelothrix sp. HDW6C]|uniref:helix-turn-helix domain-containing protein n=1 Tax=Erysipelothrix sp. HDW6C TaxID=2714930 RepID=UPI001409BEF9|nr:helix-turn-helix transcriptional regulator [Erysipelothrix sp. HDW6C]QIK70563.1 helix-turn-helix transcriptional regulator [Erysipelothrix sp. HDW6C]